MRELIYASDLDRTLIFSNRFIQENNKESEYTSVESLYGEVISNMCNKVRKKLKEINSNDKLWFIPVTTRSLEQYNRVDLGVKPEYAIVANGGKILHNGEEVQEWTEYIRRNFNYEEAMNIIADIDNKIDSVDYLVKVVDNCFLFFKTLSRELFDIEVNYLIEMYPDWDFVRQGNKCYAIPKYFSKQVALRWLWNKLNKPYIVASGDSELDLPMLTLANSAVIPSHGSLITDGYVESCTRAEGGISSALVTMDIVEQKLKDMEE